MVKVKARKGAFRYVMLAHGFVVKTPRIGHALLGMRCNRWEREMWRVWRLKFKWDCLCPILFADRCGFLVIMRRASQPASLEDIERTSDPLYPDITCEWKPEDCGLLDGRVVALDYGLPWADSVTERRAYYQAAKAAP
jgi:hypothetical protein